MRVPWVARFFGSAGSAGWNGPSRARARIRATLLALLALDAVLLALVVRPVEQAQQNRQHEMERLRDQHETVTRAVAQTRELRAKVQSAQQDGEEFSRQSFLARPRGFSAILADLERVASENQLKPSGVSYQLKEETDPSGWTNVAVNVNVEGEYSDLVRFINQLEQSPLFWIIDGLNVSAVPGKGLRMSLDMETYFAPL